MAAPMRLGVADHARLLPVLVREGLIGVLDALHRRHGPVVDFGYGSNRMVVVFGPEANEHILSTHADAFEWGEAMQALVAVDGPTALVVSDGDDHKRRSQHRPEKESANHCQQSPAWDSYGDTGEIHGDKSNSRDHAVFGNESDQGGAVRIQGLEVKVLSDAEHDRGADHGDQRDQ